MHEHKSRDVTMAMMELMQECPHCGSYDGADPWRLARRDTVVCGACGSRFVPSPELQRLALQLLRVRKAVDVEHISAANEPQ
jgi:DNA-directed RNA polymerase subunit RPC12/RpoP